LRQRRLRSDNQAVELQLGRLNERLVAKERELGNRMVKERTLTDAQAGDKRKLKEERDEAQRALIQMQQKSSQFQHELRKKDRAYAKLQEHLNGCAPVLNKLPDLNTSHGSPATLCDADAVDVARRLLEEQRREKRSAVDAVEVMKANKAKGAATKAPATESQAAKATAADNADLYTMMMDSYEAKQAALVQENSDMRHALVSMEAEMKALMNENDALKAAAAATAAAAAAAQQQKQQQQHSRARAMPVWAEHDERFADVKHGRATRSPTNASASRSDMTGERKRRPLPPTAP
jgi:regulator of replication initiation timing